VYENFFGCEEEPFRMTPDPKFFFLSKRHLEAISSLHYGIEKRKGFIEITGEIGSGKTTICRCFLSQLSENVKYALIFNPCLSESQILQAIVEDFGIEGTFKTKKDCFDAINQFLLSENSKGNNVLLIIDEAQALDVRVLEQIRLLSNLETESEKLLQIIFFGQPEFREMLRRPSLEQLRQRIGIRYHLTALSPEEMEQYIFHRLKISGVEEGSIVVTPKAFCVVYEYTKGIPRLINVLFDKILLAAYVNGTKQITYQVAEEAVYEAEGVRPNEAHFFQIHGSFTKF